MKKFKDLFEQHREEGRHKPVIPHNVKSTGVGSRWYVDSKKASLKEPQEKSILAKEELEQLDEMPGANMDTRSIHAHLKKKGWKLTRTSGSHDVFTHPESKEHIPVPRHKKLKAPLVRGILKTSERLDIKEEDQNVLTMASMTYKEKPNKEPMKKLKEDLRQWFDPKHPKGGWKRINSKGEAIGPCAREPGEPKPKCMSNEKRAALTKKERASAVRAKRKHDPNPERKGEPINVSNFGKGKISEAAYEGNIGMMEVMKFHQKATPEQKKKFKEHLANKNHKEAWKMVQQVSGTKLIGKQFEEKQVSEDMEYLEEKNVPTNPELWSRAKSMARSKFDVYPSAYANGWAAKWYKSKGGGWKSVNEELEEQMRDTQEKVEMVESQLHFIKYACEEILEYIGMGGEIEEWYQVKLAKTFSEFESLHSFVEGEARRKGMKEEVEHLDEISTDTLKSYITKSTKDMLERKRQQKIETDRANFRTKHAQAKNAALSDASRHGATAEKRATGIGKAAMKIAKKVVEEVELDEGSVQDTLHQRQQALRKKSGLPHPDYYKELGHSYSISDDKERMMKQSEIKKKYKVEEVELQEGRPSQRHPLEGHEYHKKTNAELIHIAKDAHEAAEAMKGHNTAAENKYRDQANDSATVRYFRQKSGMPDWYKKKYGHMKEETERGVSKEIERLRKRQTESMKPMKKSLDESRKAEIVKDVIKKKKEKDMEKADKFQADPILSSEVLKQ